MSTPAALLVALLATPPAAPPTDRTWSQGDIGRRLVEAVERAGGQGLSGAVLAARGGEVVATVGVGHADLDGTVPITPGTLFEIASATKQFTAAALVRLAQDRRLTLDDPISRHLPGVPEDCRAITVRHLLQHTSGIPGSNSRGGGDELESVLPLFLGGGPRHPPGTRFEYWNQGYSLLSEVIARTAGMDYTRFCAEALFAPAGMAGTRFTGERPPEGAIVAVGRSRRGPPRSALDHPYGAYGFQYRGMGGAVTNVLDLWRWDRALHGDAVLDASYRATLFSPGLNDYALGWTVRRDARGRLVQSHGGGVRGFACEVRRYPDDDACLFVLCNHDDAPVRSLVHTLEAILFEDPAEHPAQIPAAAARAGGLEAELLATLVGRYVEAARGTILVVEDDSGQARAQIRWSPPDGPVTHAVLRAGPDGAVLLDDGNATYEARLDLNDGRLTAITLQVGGSRLTFAREP